MRLEMYVQYTYYGAIVKENAKKVTPIGAMRERRTKRLNLKVSEEWYDLVEKSSESYGLSMTDVIMYGTRYFLELKPLPTISFTPTKRGRRKYEKRSK